MAKRERIYIVFHWAGLAYAMMVLFIFATGFVVVASRGLTQALGIALVVAGVVALIQSNENLRGVEITGCRSAPVAAGGEASLELTLRNAADRERIGLQVRRGLRRGGGPRWRERACGAAWLPVLDAQEMKMVRINIPTARRGRFPVPTLWVCSVMPVGLCFAWKVFSDGWEYFVYPAPRGVPLEHVSLVGKVSGAGRDQGSEDVSGHRPYEPGDMLSRLDWRVFARTGKLMVRSQEESGGDEVALRWEDTRFLENEEERLEQLSFWIAQCGQEGRAFTLTLGPAHGELNSNNLTACLEALATFGEQT